MYMYRYSLFNTLSSSSSQTLSGFVHFFRAKVQGLFKDLPGPYFEISRAFLFLELSPTEQNICRNKCTCKNEGEFENVCKHRSALVAQWTCTSNKRALGTKNANFHTFCKHFKNFILCAPDH